MWAQETLTLAKPRGCHLVTNEVVSLIFPHLQRVKIGILYIFCMHTSCSITINENCDPNVRRDMEDTLNRLVPESPLYRHKSEGPDDMPAHFKSSMLGVSHFVPIQNGKLMLGTWQGIYFCEHRDNESLRQIVLTIQGVQQE